MRTCMWCTVCILCMHPVVMLHDSSVVELTSGPHDYLQQCMGSPGMDNNAYGPAQYSK